MHATVNPALSSILQSLVIILDLLTWPSQVLHSSNKIHPRFFAVMCSDRVRQARLTSAAGANSVTPWLFQLSVMVASSG